MRRHAENLVCHEGFAIPTVRSPWSTKSSFRSSPTPRAAEQSNAYVAKARTKIARSLACPHSQSSLYVCRKPTNQIDMSIQSARRLDLSGTFLICIIRLRQGARFPSCTNEAQHAVATAYRRISCLTRPLQLCCVSLRGAGLQHHGAAMLNSRSRLTRCLAICTAGQLLLTRRRSVILGSFRSYRKPQSQTWRL